MVAIHFGLLCFHLNFRGSGSLQGTVTPGLGLVLAGKNYSNASSDPKIT